VRRNAHIQRALLAVLDATDEYRSTYELTLAAYDYPPDTDLRGISPTHIAGARYALRSLRRQGHVMAVRSSKPIGRRASWTSECWISTRGSEEVNLHRLRSLEASRPATSGDHSVNA
jgi:hypothetical protein